MAGKVVKQAVETTTQPETVAQNAAPIAINEIAPTDIEALIADEILDNLDWQKHKPNGSVRNILTKTILMMTQVIRTHRITSQITQRVKSAAPTRKEDF